MIGSLPPQAPQLVRQFLQSSESPLITSEWSWEFGEFQMAKGSTPLHVCNALSHASRGAQNGCLVLSQVCNRLSYNASSCTAAGALRGLRVTYICSVGPWVKKLALARRAENLGPPVYFIFLIKRFKHRSHKFVFGWIIFDYRVNWSVITRWSLTVWVLIITL